MKNNKSNLNSVCGLNNLGNTCFFNSVLQNLAQTAYLEQLLDETLIAQIPSFAIKHNDEYDSELTDFDEEASKISSVVTKQPSFVNGVDSDENHGSKATSSGKSKSNKIETHRSIRLPDLNLTIKESAGLLTRNFFDVIKSMKTSNSVINPYSLFSLICKRVPSFKGFQQQDSHELLRNLLDAIKTEELKRRQAAILENFCINPKSIDDLTKIKIKRYGRLASYTLIDKVFGGHLVSTIVCDICNICMQRVEPFLDLSLSIADESLSASSVVSSAHDHVSKHMNKFRHNQSSKGSKTKGSKSSADEFKKDNQQPFNEQQGDKKVSKHQEKKMRKQNKKSKKKWKYNEKNDEGASDEEEKKDEKREENIQIDFKKETVELTKSIGDLNCLEENNEKTAEGLNESDEDNDAHEKESSQDENEEENNSLNKFRQEVQKSSDSNRQYESGTLQYYLARFTHKERLNDKINCENCTRKLNLTSLSSSSASKFSLSRLMNSIHLNSSNSRKAYTHATKQYLICELPAILTIHLKRFQQHGFRLEKSNKFVEFPLMLDMTPFTSKMCVNGGASATNNQRSLYALYGLVEHSGRLNSGHYTACVRAMNASGCEKLCQFLSKQRLCHLNKIFKQWSTGELSSSTGAESASASGVSSGLDDAKWYYVSDSHVSEMSVAKVLKTQAYILFYQRVQ